MKILYIGYWGANEGLSQATINPHLQILADFKEVESVTYVSVERDLVARYQVPKHSKIRHVPYISKNRFIRFLNKFSDVIGMRKSVFFQHKKHAFDLVICRSSLAGIFGYFLHKRFKVPYVVESFEPHAEYMRELGIWKRWGISYMMQDRWETKQKQTASWLLPVSTQYTRLIKKEGVLAKLATVPCAVRLDKFKFNEEDRTAVRKKLRIDKGAVVGIYVGKFGGIYMDQEAFEIFKLLNNKIRNFHLIILGHKRDDLIARLNRYGISDDKVYVDCIEHSTVPKYLSASDFGLALIRPSPNRKHCSPVKNGEYWANGLPIVISQNIGDDSDLIRQTGLGIVFEDIKDLKESLALFDFKEARFSQAHKVVALAAKHRSFNGVVGSYLNIIEDIG